MFFAAPAKGECDHLLKVARQALDAGRRLARVERSGERALSASERTLTHLTASAVRVFEELCMLARLNRGRVYPSYDRLAEVTGLGRATIARALTALERAGFLLRQRRFTRVEGERAGPRYAQTSNAYRPLLPRRIMGLLPRWMRPAPVPCDQAQHAADQAEQLAAMKATLSARELAQVTVGGALGRVLAELGAALDARACESRSEPQPLLMFNNIAQCGCRPGRPTASGLTAGRETTACAPSARAIGECRTARLRRSECSPIRAAAWAACYHQRCEWRYVDVSAC